MNDFFSWRKKLNFKKVIIVSVIVLILLSLLIYLAISRYKTHKEEKRLLEIEEAKPTKIYLSTDNTFSIELSKTYNLLQNLSSDNYVLDSYSNENLGIHISKMSKIENKSLEKVASADRLAYSESFGTYSNLSEMRELLVGDIPAYTYSLHYLDTNLNKAFYLQIVWIELNNEYYILDIDFPLDNITSYSAIVTDTLSSFTLLK